MKTGKIVVLFLIQPYHTYLIYCALLLLELPRKKDRKMQAEKAEEKNCKSSRRGAANFRTAGAIVARLLAARASLK